MNSQSIFCPIIKKLEYERINDILSIETLNEYFEEYCIKDILVTKLGHRLNSYTYPVYISNSSLISSEKFRKNNPNISREYNNLIEISPSAVKLKY